MSIRRGGGYRFKDSSHLAKFLRDEEGAGGYRTSSGRAEANRNKSDVYNRLATTDNVVEWPEETSVTDQYALPIVEVDFPWTDYYLKHAACSGQSTDPMTPWFPEWNDEYGFNNYKDSVAYCKEVCAECPVIDLCRLYVDELEGNRIDPKPCAGVWAGQTPVERTKRRRESRREMALAVVQGN